MPGKVFRGANAPLARMCEIYGDGCFVLMEFWQNVAIPGGLSNISLQDLISPNYPILKIKKK